jgi:hypothetical protein
MAKLPEARISNRLSVAIVPMIMPAMASEVVVNPTCAVTDWGTPERLTENPADHPTRNRADRTGNHKPAPRSNGGTDHITKLRELLRKP